MLPKPFTKYPAKHSSGKHISTPKAHYTTFASAGRKIIEQFNIKKCILMTTPSGYFAIYFSLLIKNFVRPTGVWSAAYDTDFAAVFLPLFSAPLVRRSVCVDGRRFDFGARGATQPKSAAH